MTTTIDTSWTPHRGERLTAAWAEADRTLTGSHPEWVERAELVDAMAAAGNILPATAGGLLTAGCRAGVLLRSPAPRNGRTYVHPRRVRGGGAKKFRINPDALDRMAELRVG